MIENITHDRPCFKRILFGNCRGRRSAGQRQEAPGSAKCASQCRDDVAFEIDLHQQSD
jgi:hypothetical protein